MVVVYTGCNNKAKWILSTTKWDKIEALSLLPEGIALAMHDIAAAKAIDNYINR